VPSRISGQQNYSATILTPKPGDEGLDDASADIKAFDFGAVRCRNELRYQKILKFSPWIVLAEKIRLVPQVGPLDLLVAS